MASITFGELYHGSIFRIPGNDTRFVKVSGMGVEDGAGRGFCHPADSDIVEDTGEWRSIEVY